jgi:hypothetical protein
MADISWHPFRQLSCIFIYLDVNKDAIFFCSICSASFEAIFYRVPSELSLLRLILDFIWMCHSHERKHGEVKSNLLEDVYRSIYIGPDV